MNLWGALGMCLSSAKEKRAPQDLRRSGVVMPLRPLLLVCASLAVSAVALGQPRSERSPLEIAYEQAETLRKQGKLPEAVRLYEKTLQLAEKTSGKTGREAEAS